MADKGLEDVPEGMLFSSFVGPRTALRPPLNAAIPARLPRTPPRTPPRTHRHGLWSLIFFRCAGQIESNYDETVDSFDEMNLKAELLRGMSATNKFHGD